MVTATRPLKAVVGIGFFTAKSGGLIIPSYQADSLTLGDAVAIDGVRILVDERKINTDRPETLLETVSLDETNVKLGTLLLKITEQLDVRYRIDPYGVVFVPRSDRVEAFFTRRYPWQGDLTTNNNLMEKLRGLGMAFRDGATATLSDDGETLIVRSTQAELDRVDHYFDNFGPVPLEWLGAAIHMGKIVNPIFTTIDSPQGEGICD